MAKIIKPLTGIRDLEASERDNQFIMSLARGFELVRLFEPALGALSNSELSRMSGLSKPTVARITHTLSRLGYLEYLPRLERYRLGAGILALGHSYIGALDINAIARHLMTEIATKFDITVAMGVRDRLDIVYTEVAYGASLRGIRLDIGSRVPISLSAIGMAYIHALGEQQREFLRAELKSADPDEWVELDRQIISTGKELDQRGFCLVAGRYDQNIVAVAAAIPGLPGSPPLVLNAAIQSFRPHASRLAVEIGHELTEAAGRIGEQVFRRGDRSS